MNPLAVLPRRVGLALLLLAAAARPLVADPLVAAPFPLRAFSADPGSAGPLATSPVVAVAGEPASWHVLAGSAARGEHPVRKLSRVRGVALADLLGEAVDAPFSDAALRAGAERFLAEHAALLALTAGSGRLVPAGVQHASGFASVRYRQVARLADGNDAPVLGSDVRVVFDGRGALTQVLYRAWLGVDGLAPPALDGASVAASALRRAEPVPGADAPAHAIWVGELGVHVGDDGRPRLAYRARLAARVAESARSFEALLSARDGALLDAQPLWVPLQQGPPRGAPVPTQGLAKHSGTTFYASFGADPAGDQAFRDATPIAPHVETCDELLGPVDRFWARFPSGALSVDVRLADGSGHVGAETADLVSFPVVPGANVPASYRCLANTSGGVKWPRVALVPERPVRSLGLWIFDDDAASEDHFVLRVRDALGNVFVSDVFESGNGTTPALEGFLGAVSEVGIARVDVHVLGPGPTPRFLIDGIELAGVPELGAPSFFLATASAPEGEPAFRSAAALLAEQTFQFVYDLPPGQTEIGEFFATFPRGLVQLDVSLLDAEGALVSDTACVSQLQGDGAVYDWTLTNESGGVRAPRIELVPSNAAAALGAWIWDGTDTSDERFRVHVTDRLGGSYTSPWLDAGNGLADGTEGFVGAVSSAGIASFVVEVESLTADPGDPVPEFRLDGVLIAPGTVRDQGVLGSGLAWDPNPIEAVAPLVVALPGLDANHHSLIGSAARVHVPFNGQLLDAFELDRQFEYAGLPFPDGEHVGEVSTYSAAVGVARYLEALGFTDVVPREQVFRLFLFAAPSGFYVPSTREIWLRLPTYGNDLDVVLHEYAHATHHRIGGSGPALLPFGTGDGLSAAMSEGLAYYFSTSYLNDYEWEEWVADANGHPFGGSLDTDFTASLNQAPPWDPSTNGRIFGAAFWDLREKLGKGTADRLALRMVSSVLPSDDFDDALETCVLQADLDLYGGAHEDVIRRVFALRGITGSAPPPTWPTPFPASARPYPDVLDDTQTWTELGASALFVTFDAYTRVYTTPPDYNPNWQNLTDRLHVSDGADVPIAGSPFVGRELRNRTLVVPGDTVKLRLESAADARHSSGYRVIGIAAEDPLNLPPLPVLEASATAVTAPAVVSFDASLSGDPDGSLLAYTLDPGDGSPTIWMDPGALVVEHVYHRDGVGPLLAETLFTATLTITDDSGVTASTAVDVLVSPGAP